MEKGRHIGGGEEGRTVKFHDAKKGERRKDKNCNFILCALCLSYSNQAVQNILSFQNQAYWVSS